MSSKVSNRKMSTTLSQHLIQVIFSEHLTCELQTTNPLKICKTLKSSKQFKRWMTNRLGQQHKPRSGTSRPCRNVHVRCQAGNSTAEIGSLEDLVPVCRFALFTVRINDLASSEWTECCYNYTIGLNNRIPKIRVCKILHMCFRLFYLTNVRIEKWISCF